MQHRLRGLVASALLGILAACGTVAERLDPPSSPEPRPSAQATPQATPPQATPPQAPSTPPAGSPGPIELSAPTSGAWRSLGTIEVGQWGSIDYLIRFNPGYLAWGVHADSIDQPTVTTWFSADGAAWTATSHSTMVAPCPGWYERPNIESPYTGVSDGGSVVLIASVLDSPTSASCDERQLLGMRTSDGTTWERSAPFGSGWAESTWLTPTGFETRSNDGTIWASSDGLAWQRVTTAPAAELAVYRVIGTASDGTRLAYSGSDDGGYALLASQGAGPWREVERVPEWHSVAAALRADGDAPWLIAFHRGLVPHEPALLMASGDLVSWDSVSFKRTGIGPIVRTDRGLFAVGYDLEATNIVGCQPCPDANRSLYWSADGTEWTQVATSDDTLLGGIVPGGFGVSPEDMVAVQPHADGRHTVWVLVTE